MFEHFSDERVVLPNGIGLRVRRAGDGPAILLLHGYPQTHVCWHLVAPKLVEAGFHVVLSDLRGYGDSDKPTASLDHMEYSKRAMAADQAALMTALGFEQFFVAGHDRGGRVAHRLARDNASRVLALAVLDIAPTEYMYKTTNCDFATGYYHWFFLIQPAPLPERLLAAEPKFYLESKLTAWSKGNRKAFTPEAFAEYLRCFSDVSAIHASCEDYRAAASIDLMHDAENAGQRLPMPLLALWGAKGLVGRLYDVVDIWRQYANIVEGEAFDCGHFLPEEAPEDTASALIAFFRKERLA